MKIILTPEAISEFILEYHIEKYCKSYNESRHFVELSEDKTYYFGLFTNLEEHQFSLFELSTERLDDIREKTKEHQETVYAYKIGLSNELAIISNKYYIIVNLKCNDIINALHSWLVHEIDSSIDEVRIEYSYEIDSSRKFKYHISSENEKLLHIEIFNDIIRHKTSYYFDGVYNSKFINSIKKLLK